MNMLNSNKIRLVVVGIVATIMLCVTQITIADFVIGEATCVDEAINKPGCRDTQGCSFLHDGLKLYFAHNRPDGYGKRDIWVTTRETTVSPWQEAVNLGANINSAEGSPCYPAISPDDLELYFHPSLSGTDSQQLMRSTRASKDEPWGSAELFTGLGHACYLDFSADGLTVYFSSGGGYGGWDIWMATRETVDSPWGTRVNLGPNVNDSRNQYGPSISNDGLIMCFHDGSLREISVCKRATKDNPWGQPVLLGSAVNGYGWVLEPEISPDGSALYFDSGRSGGINGENFWHVSIKPFVDFTEDGMVDIDDLLAMIEYWGTDHSFYDIAPAAWGDGVVDCADLEVLMSYYGQTVDYLPESVIDVKLPHNPQPGDGWTTDVEKALPLSWTPGDTATVHDLYLGTDRAAVENANISDTSGVYRGEQSGNSYTPPEGVQSGQTYYWRVDEVRSKDYAKKGEIWSFTVIDGLIVDNFESYNDEFDEGTWEGTTIWNTWIDAYSIWTSGSLVGYPTPPFAETTIVHSGAQAMPLTYDNDGTLFEGEEDEVTGVPYYSETQRTWDEPQDWTRRDVKVLTLWVYGEPDNSAEPFYVGLEDSEGNRKDITHPNPAVLTVNDWQQWSIPLTNFTDVDLTAIKVMYFGVGDPADSQPGGSGLVRIDDIELHLPATE